MVSDESPPRGRTFFSADVAQIAAVTLRQLQWWDERKLVSPRKDERRRIYVAEQVLEILTLAALRRKGLSLLKIRKVLRQSRREFGRRADDLWSGESRLYLLTDGNSVFIGDQPGNILDRLTAATAPAYLICLTAQVKRIASFTRRARPRRGRSRQLALFDNSEFAIRN